MSDMVEKVARAILYDFMPHVDAWEIVDEANRNRCRSYARAAIEAIEPELRACIAYFDGYAQDEADDEENCLAGTNQHRDAVAFAEAVKALRASLQGDEAVSDTDISRALKDARRIFNANGEAFAMAGGLPARLDNVVIGVIARAILAERERCAKIAELYADVSWEKCTDSILLDPVLSNRGRRPLTSEDWKRSDDMQIDGTISSAAYHAANHIATSIRQGSQT